MVKGPVLSRHAVIEFPLLEAAIACDASDAYQAAKRCGAAASPALDP